MDPEDFTIVIFLYKLYTKLYINNMEELNQASVLRVSTLSLGRVRTTSRDTPLSVLDGRWG